MQNLKIGANTSAELKSTFAGVFAILDLGRQVLDGVASVFAKLFSQVLKGSGGFLQFTAYIGNMIVAFDQAVKKGQGLANFFQALGNILVVPIQILTALHDLIFGLFEGFDPNIGQKVNQLFGTIDGSTDNLTKKLSGLGSAFHNVGQSIGKALSNIDWGTVLAGVSTGLLGASAR